jgi:hypothetical protein
MLRVKRENLPMSCFVEQLEYSWSHSTLSTGDMSSLNRWQLWKYLQKNCFNSKLTKWLENLEMILCVLVSWVNLLVFIVTISNLFCFHDTILCRWIYNYLCNAYHHLNWEFESYSWRGVLDTTLCDKVCQWLVTGQLFSPPIKLTATI